MDRHPAAALQAEVSSEIAGEVAAGKQATLAAEQSLRDELADIRYDNPQAREAVLGCGCAWALVPVYDDGDMHWEARWKVCEVHEAAGVEL